MKDKLKKRRSRSIFSEAMIKSREKKAKKHKKSIEQELEKSRKSTIVDLKKEKKIRTCIFWRHKWCSLANSDYGLWG